MASKSNGFFDDLAERGEKRARRKAKSKIKKLHTATKVIAVLSLVVGLLIVLLMQPYILTPL